MGRCFVKIVKLAGRCRRKETGSILVGHYTADGRSATILDVSPIARDSVSSSCAYVRGTEGVRKYYRKLQRNSGGRFHFVGEWHTHPFASPVPSGCDRATLQQIAQEEAIGCASPLLLILGHGMNRPTDIELFWCVGKHLERMEPINSES